MPLVIPPGFANVALEFITVGDPDPWLVTFGVDAGFVDGDPQEIAKTCRNAFWQGFGQHIATGQRLSGVHITVGQDAADNIQYYDPSPAGFEGSDNAGMLPQNCALLMRKYTGLGGRRNRGRFFVPGVLKEGTVDNVGNINPFEVNEFNDSGSIMLTTLEVGDTGNDLTECPMVVLHSDGISEVIDPTRVTSLTPDNVISTQRRRLR